jgi:hypothetical protein
MRMDPNLFHLDWSKLLEALAAVIVLSFVVERALALVFEHRLYVAALNQTGLKEPIAFLVSFLICWQWDFDLLSIVMTAESTSLLGKIITGAVIAGGSKASIKLFHDVLDTKSTAQKAKEKAAN